MVYDLVHIRPQGGIWVMRSHVFNARSEKQALSKARKFLATPVESVGLLRQPVRLIKVTVVKRWTGWRKKRR